MSDIIPSYVIKRYIGYFWINNSQEKGYVLDGRGHWECDISREHVIVISGVDAYWDDDEGMFYGVYDIGRDAFDNNSSHLDIIKDEGFILFTLDWVDSEDGLNCRIKGISEDVKDILEVLLDQKGYKR